MHADIYACIYVSTITTRILILWSFCLVESAYTPETSGVRFA